jgi:hypothetical protein
MRKRRLYLCVLGLFISTCLLASTKPLGYKAPANIKINHKSKISAQNQILSAVKVGNSESSLYQGPQTPPQSTPDNGLGTPAPKPQPAQTQQKAGLPTNNQPQPQSTPPATNLPVELPICHYRSNVINGCDKVLCPDNIVGSCSSCRGLPGTVAQTVCLEE